MTNYILHFIQWKPRCSLCNLSKVIWLEIARSGIPTQHIFLKGPYQGNTFTQIKLECVKKKGNIDFKRN